MLILCTKKMAQEYHFQVAPPTVKRNGLFDTWYASSFSINDIFNFFCFIHEKSRFCVFHLFANPKMTISETLFYSLGILFKYYDYPKMDINLLFDKNQKITYGQLDNSEMILILNSRINLFIDLFLKDLSMQKSASIESISELINTRHYMDTKETPRDLFSDQMKHVDHYKSIFIQ